LVENFKWVSIFLNLQWVIKGGGSNNLTTMLMKFMATFGDLFDDDMASKSVWFAIDGVTILGYENRGDSATHKEACTICH